MSPVNWDEQTSDDYIQIEEGVNKQMYLKGWKPQTMFKDEKTGELRPGVTFTVMKEDSQEFTEASAKEWTVTAKGALRQLAPLCKAAEAKGSEELYVTVVAIGKGKERKYSIKEIPAF